MEFALDEYSIRLVVFFSLLLLFALWEVLNPRVISRIPKTLRWSRNLSLVLLNTLLIRLLIPISALSLSLYASEMGIGLFNNVSLNPVLVILLSLLFLDALIYYQHVLFHRFPLLWRLHQIHHIDQEIDVTTGLRFHPIEILLSMVIKFSAVLILGIPALAYLIFEILLNSLAMFNHSNIKLPNQVDQLLRKVIVTPDMHRIHHSTLPMETDSNFGFNLSIWDRLFKTYRAEAQKKTEEIQIGLKEFLDFRQTDLIFLLKLPFKAKEKKN